MRKRFRGNKPVGLGSELDGPEGNKEVPMLYAGKSAGGSVVKSTSGDEDTKV